VPYVVCLSGLSINDCLSRVFGILILVFKCIDPEDKVRSLCTNNYISVHYFIFVSELKRFIKTFINKNVMFMSTNTAYPQQCNSYAILRLVPFWTELSYWHKS
jgi:hypothetical protein